MKLLVFVLLLSAFVLLIKSDQIYYDPQSNFYWQRCSGSTFNTVFNCQKEPQLFDWQGALIYCKNLKIGFHDDWHLPSRNELLSIINWKTRTPAINEKLKKLTKNNVYWSSTTDSEAPDTAYYVSMFSGYSYSNRKYVQGYVRCVRK